MRLEDLGLIGNCQFSALVDRTGTVAWCCLPRFDSDPIFGALLDAQEGGAFQVAPAAGGAGAIRYLDNTNILETVHRTPEGRLRVVDFAPRFEQYGRMFHPTQLVRIVEPLEGTPRIRVRCEPRLGWSREKPVAMTGSNHIRFEGFGSPLRLTTDLPLSYLGGQPFTLTGRRHLMLTWGAPVEEPLPPLCDRFLGETTRYWRQWVKQCDIPALFQQEVIRSALALKLHCFEDTGSIVASMTTSIPEAPDSGRTWDYRYCWLRDAYYALDAFRLLGHFEEREAFVHFLLNLAGGTPDLALAPLYRVDGSLAPEEQLLEAWPGYEGGRPVRMGNAAALQHQNDIFGEMVLALAPIFLDYRFEDEQSKTTLDLVERLARKAITVAGTPDAGIWEFRANWQPQTFSSLMCWAAVDRMARVARRHRPESVDAFVQAGDRIRAEILSHAWQEEIGGFGAAYGSRDLDASLLQMAGLRMLPPDDPKMHRAVETIWKGLNQEGWLLRYRRDDGLGPPRVAFVLCTFWLVEALATIGRTEAARSVLRHALTALSPLGLLSEDFDTESRRLWGNFPQAYSHVGLIHAAFSASPSWSEVL